jgi:hypothetical protein
MMKIKRLSLRMETVALLSGGALAGVIGGATEKTNGCPGPLFTAAIDGCLTGVQCPSPVGTPTTSFGVGYWITARGGAASRRWQATWCATSIPTAPITAFCCDVNQRSPG